MPESQKVYYNPIYGRILIVLGIVFNAIFILGYLIADIHEALFYTILGLLMIIIGYGIIKGPYAVYNEQSIILYTYGFKVRENILFKDKNEISVKGNSFYQNGRKLKMNSWFIRKSEWKRMANFYSDSSDSLLSELKDSSSL